MRNNTQAALNNSLQQRWLEINKKQSFKNQPKDKSMSNTTGGGLSQSIGPQTSGLISSIGPSGSVISKENKSLDLQSRLDQIKQRLGQMKKK